MLSFVARSPVAKGVVSLLTTVQAARSKACTKYSSKKTVHDPSKKERLSGSVESDSRTGNVRRNNLPSSWLNGVTLSSVRDDDDIGSSADSIS